MPKLDQARAQAAVDKAFDEAVEREIANLISNLIDVASASPSGYFKTAEQCATAFGKGFALANKAYEIASDFVEKQIQKNA